MEMRTKGDSHLKPRQEGRLETIALFRSGALRTGALAAVAAKSQDKGACSYEIGLLLLL
jgi:hypothetical protein